MEFDTTNIWQRLEADLAQEQGAAAKARSLPTSGRIVLAMAAFILLELIVYFTTIRADWAVYPTVRFAAEATGLALLLGITTLFALRPLHKVLLSLGTTRMAWGVSSMAIIALALLPAAHYAHEASLIGGLGNQFAQRAVACLLFGLVVSLPAMGMVWLLDRQPSFRAPVATIGALVGNLALLLHCPIVHEEHRLAGHVTVLFVLFAAVLLAGWLRIRKSPNEDCSA